MSFNAENEIGKLWKALHASQSEIGKNYFRWRHVVIDLLRDSNISNDDVISKVANFSGKDVSKSFLPRLNWLKGERNFILSLGLLLANLWIVDGGVAVAEQEENSNDVFIRCNRDVWPTWAKEYSVDMKELIFYREKFLESILEEINLFFNVDLNFKIEKSIPAGEGLWLIKLYKNDY